MKLSINSAALERLIGGDSEMEVELRQQVAERFIERHFRKVMKDMAMGVLERQWRERIKEECESILRDAIQVKDTNAINSSLPWWNLKRKIEDEVQKVIESAIHEKVEGVVARLERQISLHIKNEVELQVKRRFLQLSETATKISHSLHSEEKK